MLRNREILLYFVAMGVISTIAIIIGFIITATTGWLMIVVSFLLMLITYFYTRWRYLEIEKLSGYLRQISSGDYTLDVRDNKEGELSILKNEIYKVTSILAEYNVHLNQDKLHLSNAISDISHQLKTPLTSMTVMADLLSQPDLPINKRQEFIRNILLQLERLDWLVTSLLKLSKIDAGTVYFKQDRILVKDLIEQALEPLLIPIDIKQQHVCIQGDENVTIEADFQWTKEALINVVKNCIEHTPDSGKIDIKYASNVLYTEIIIRDYGKGMPKADLPYIFHRFYKGKHASEESVGIGLAMAYQIITSQGGDIEVMSEEGKGTQFHFKFYHQDQRKKQ